MDCCSPIFSEISDDQVQVTWPAPGNITESMATEICRAIIVNTTFIGQSCFDSLNNDSASDNIVEACMNDVQVQPRRFLV